MSSLISVQFRASQFNKFNIKFQWLYKCLAHSLVYGGYKLSAFTNCIYNFNKKSQIGRSTRNLDRLQRIVIGKASTKQKRRLR